MQFVVSLSHQCLQSRFVVSASLAHFHQHGRACCASAMHILFWATKPAPSHTKKHQKRLPAPNVKKPKQNHKSSSARRMGPSSPQHQSLSGSSRNAIALCVSLASKQQQPAFEISCNAESPGRVKEGKEGYHHHLISSWKGLNCPPMVLHFGHCGVLPCARSLSKASTQAVHIPQMHSGQA